jgi:cyclophilin family peptidyl-prolyl cis-trans isomerase
MLHRALKILLAGWCWLSVLGCSNSPDNESALPVHAVIHTNYGDIALHLYEETPGHKENFLKLAQQGFYDGLPFHRITPFIIQTGDPRYYFSEQGRIQADTSREDGPGYDLPAEIHPKFMHTAGKLGAARWGDEENPERKSSGSQFYLVLEQPLSRSLIDSMEQAITGMRKGAMYQAYQAEVDSVDGEPVQSFAAYLEAAQFEPFHYPPAVLQQYLESGGAPWLDQAYTVFGEVVSGLEVVNRIGLTPVDEGGRPRKRVEVLSVDIPPTAN